MSATHKPEYDFSNLHVIEVSLASLYGPNFSTLELLGMISIELLEKTSVELLEYVSLSLLYGTDGEFSLLPSQLAPNRAIAENKILFQCLRMYIFSPDTCRSVVFKIKFLKGIDKLILFSLQFDYIIRGVNKVLRMLDGNDCVACVAKPVNEAEQLLNVLFMEAAGGFVKEE